ncbi:hypothetical protein SP15_106 [Bacillus phage SP-15]|uniref:Uncharacterized protein n=1 Tax=Bacillus phage SP-15 TaxID=1792032 RepID=A0A127AW95_9CAUD|nr:hypothetical protein SP15_106 [Bacillus phage SP-15]AMM44905.1 hypothetical protein SP15_106 [Bacillus phage SP-15]
MAQPPIRITEDAVLKRVQVLLKRKLTKNEQQMVKLAVATNSAINSLIQEQRNAPVVPKSPGSTSADRSTSIEGAKIEKF